MSRLLKTGNNQITQSYIAHVNKANAGTGWARGVDLVKQTNQVDTLTAHSDGTVIKIMTGQKNGTNDPEGMGYGNYVMIQHAGNYVTMYAHMESVSVTKGQKVTKGQIIGKMGNTGHSYGAHLHFELRKYSTINLNALHNTTTFVWLDPTPYLEKDLPGTPAPTAATYRVQVGAFSSKTNAMNYARKVKSDMGSAIIKFYENTYHVQVGAYSVNANAEAMKKKCIAAGYAGAFITTKDGIDIPF